jgi:hypothetical protein
MRTLTKTESASGNEVQLGLCHLLAVSYPHSPASPDSNLLPWKVPPMPDSGRSDFVTKLPKVVGPRKPAVNSSHSPYPTLPPEAGALDWLLAPKENPTTDRILARLIQAEIHELNPHFKDDYRISWLTVLYAYRGDAKECTPHVLATYTVLGVHPDRVWRKICQDRVRKGFPSSAEGFTYNREAAKKSGMSEHADTCTAPKRVEYSADSVPSPTPKKEVA